MNISDQVLDHGIHCIHLAGRMDIAGTGTIELRLAGMMAAPRNAIVLDLGEVSYLSSIGIRALLANAKSVARRGGRCVISRPTPDVRLTLEMSGIDQIIPLAATQEDALTALAGEA